MPILAAIALLLLLKPYFYSIGVSWSRQKEIPFEIYDSSTALLRKFQSSTYQNRQGGRWFQIDAMFLQSKNSRPAVYTDVHCWTGYFQKAYGKWYFRTATEGGGSTQKRRFCAAKTRVQKCTRMYTSGQAISKGLRKGFSVSMTSVSATVDR